MLSRAREVVGFEDRGERIQPKEDGRHGVGPLTLASPEVRWPKIRPLRMDKSALSFNVEATTAELGQQLAQLPSLCAGSCKALVYKKKNSSERIAARNCAESG